MAAVLPKKIHSRTMQAMSDAASRPSFASVYASHKDALYTYVFYRVNRDTDVAADIVSDVFLKAYRSFDSYDARYSIRTWLYTITKRTLIDHYRRYRAHVDIDDMELSDGTDPLFEMVNAQATPFDVERALQTLPESQRACIRAQFWEGQTSKEIAEQLDMSPEAVRKQVSRGLAGLRVALSATLLAVFHYIPHL